MPTIVRVRSVLWFVLIGIGAGIGAGFLWRPSVSLALARYAAAWLLCCLEGLLALLAGRELERVSVAVVRSLVYLAITGVLLALSDRLDMQLYLAAFAALGVRIFAHLDALIGGIGHAG